MGCPGGMGLIRYTRLVFTRAFWTIFLKVLLEWDCNEKKKDRCAVFGCNNDRRFPEKYMVKDHSSFFGGTFLLLEGHKALDHLDETTEPEEIWREQEC